MGKKITTKDFIEKAKTFHGNKYDYTFVDYINNTTPICIICPKHGEFWQIPATHYKHDCPECGKDKKILKLYGDNEKRTKDWIEKVKIIHGDKYDYSNSNYTNSYNKIKIICSIHGEFEQIANDHLGGSNCPKCQKNYKKDYLTKLIDYETDISKHIIENPIIANKNILIGSIYIFINKINNKKYIGKTTLNYKTRFSGHLYISNKKNYHFYNSIQKYGWDNFDKYIIYQTDIKIKDKIEINNILSEKEIYFINLFQTTNEELGYNKTKGGDGIVGSRHSEEFKSYMSKIMTGEGNSMYGKTLGKNPRAIPIVQLDLNDNYIKTWSCAVEIKNELNYSLTSIRNCYNKKQKNYKGYKWVKESDYLENLK